MKRWLAIVAGLGVLTFAAAVAYKAFNPTEVAATADTVIEVIDGLAVTYLATPALFEERQLHPTQDFGVALNGNVVLNAREGVLELEVSGQELAIEVLNPPPPLDSLALDGGAVMLGIQGRFFGQVGPDGFQRAFPLPPGRLRLATSSRAGWVYLFRNQAGGTSRLYGIWDNGTLSALAEFPARIRAVADDGDTVFVATDRALLGVNEERVRVIAEVTPDLGPADALAASAGRLFVAANDQVYLLAEGGTLLTIARGIRPQLRLVGDRLYCWDWRRRLLIFIDVGPLFAA